MAEATWDQWQVHAYRGKRGEIKLGNTFVRAKNEEDAKRIGKEAMKILGVRGQFFVWAAPYYPWRDLKFNGYIAKAKEESHGRQHRSG